MRAAELGPIQGGSGERGGEKSRRRIGNLTQCTSEYRACALSCIGFGFALLGFGLADFRNIREIAHTVSREYRRYEVGLGNEKRFEAALLANGAFDASSPGGIKINAVNIAPDHKIFNAGGVLNDDNSSLKSWDIRSRAPFIA